MRLKIIIIIFIIIFIFISTYGKEANTKKSTGLVKQKTTKTKEGPGSDKWLEILKAFETHTHSAKELLKKYATEKYNSLEKKLAAQLLKEWEINENLYDLMNPFPLKYGKYKVKRVKTVRPGTVLIELKVNEIGGVEEAKIIKSTIPNPPYDIEGLKQSVFRPAFNGKKFIPATHHFGIQLVEQ